MATNRNGHFGDFERFFTEAPAFDSPGYWDFALRKRGEDGWTPREVAIAELRDGYKVLRHGLDWRDLEPVYTSVNSQGDPVPRDQQLNSAVYSIRSADGVTVMCMRVWGGDRGVEIMDVAVPFEQLVGADVIVAALVELDFHPGSWASWIAGTFDCWYEDGSWSLRTPTQAVSVTLERMCFDTAPAMKETVDVLVPFEDGYPFDGGPDRVGDAVHHYGAVAMSRRDTLPGLRPGFSSWMTSGAVLVKMVGPSAAAEFEALRQPAPSALIRA